MRIAWIIVAWFMLSIPASVLIGMTLRKRESENIWNSFDDETKELFRVPVTCKGMGDWRKNV